MKIAAVADAHVGNHRRFGGLMEAGINARCRIVLQCIHRAALEADAHGCDYLAFLGDTFDTASPSPQHIKAVMDAASGDARKIYMKGNHEMVSDAEDDHALGPMQALGFVFSKVSFLADKNAVVGMVPFQPGAARDWFPKAVKAAFDHTKGKLPPKINLPRALFFHLGVSDDSTPAWLQGAHDSVDKEMVFDLMDEHGVEVAFCGNWHEHKVWTKGKKIIVQVGTLAPTGFDNPGSETYGRVVIWDSEAPSMKGRIKVIEVPGPRFLKLPMSELDGFLAADAELRLDTPLKQSPRWGGYSLFAQISCAAEDAQATQDKAQRMKDAGILVGFDVVPDEAQAQAAARCAATSARSADTLDEAITGFVTALPMPVAPDWWGDPDQAYVGHGDVIARSKRYLGAA